MTAEIVVLNKSAVALAADSAVTIGTEQKNQKVFDTADKLFELSDTQPIGVMIYNGMQYAGLPVPELVKEFRARRMVFSRIKDASAAFLDFLSIEGQSAPSSIADQTLTTIVSEAFTVVRKRISDRTNLIIIGEYEIDEGSFLEHISEYRRSQIKLLTHVYNRVEPAKFHKRKTSVKLSKGDKNVVHELITYYFPNSNDDETSSLLDLAEAAVNSSRLSRLRTGFVFAGFGSSDRFPTLHALEVDGYVGRALKYVETTFCDVDRDGPYALVKPFAQQEMVDRFLYGFDQKVQRGVMQFVKKSVREVCDQIIDHSGVSGDDLVDLRSRANLAQEILLEDLKGSAFDQITSTSQTEIENMVRFMGKPDLARMAEALVELTSIKRKVTAGMETVGGPIDVAVISKSEGFVWVKRKHYFSPELNSRYAARLLNVVRQGERHEDS